MDWFALSELCWADVSGDVDSNPRYRCKLPGHIRERISMNSSRPPMRIPAARGETAAAAHRECDNWFLLFFALGLLRSLAENRAVDDDVRRGADCRVLGLSSGSSSVTSVSRTFAKPSSS